MRLVKYAMKQKKMTQKRFGKKPSQLELEWYKALNQKYDEIANTKYSEHAAIQSPIYKEEFMVFANQAIICGINDDDYNINDTILQTMETFSPECMVLGKMCYTDMERFRHGQRVFFYPPNYEEIKKEQTMATKELDMFINVDMDVSTHFFNDVFEDCTVFLGDHERKRKIVIPELSLAKVFTENKKKQLFFGAPNQLYVIEDICLNYTLDELKEIFLHAIEHYRQHNEKGEYVPQTEPIDYKFNLRQSILVNHKNMFNKQMMYTASVTRKLLKLYKKVGLTCENAHTRKIRKYIEDPNLPEFDKIFHQNEYFTKLKTILARDQDCEVLIEKLAILSYLQTDLFRSYLECGVNPLHQMFSSRYEYIPLEDLIVIFYEKLQPYKAIVEDSFFRQLETLKTAPSHGRYSVEPYQQTIERVDKKRTKDYEYPVDVMERDRAIVYSNSIIMKQMYKNIWKKEQEGIDQTRIKMDLYEFFQKTPTKGNLMTFQQLFAEANAQLGLLRLPEDFIRHKEIIYRQTYKLVKESSGKDEKMLEKEMAVAEQTQQMNQFYSSVSAYSSAGGDGSVKALDSLAKQEGKRIESEHGDLPPNEKEEIFQEWFERHYKLENLKQKYSDKSPEISSLQQEIKGKYQSDIKETDYLMNYEGELIKKNEAEMNYMLFSEDGKRMPFDIKEVEHEGKRIKLPEKVTRSDLESLGFQDVGMISLEKDVDGKYRAKADQQENKVLSESAEKIFGKDFLSNQEGDSGEEIEDDVDPSFREEFVKTEFSEKDLELRAHLDKLSSAFEAGEVYDHEDFYRVLDNNPHLKKNFEMNKLKRRKRIERRIQDDEKITDLHNRIEQSEIKQKEIDAENYETNKEAEIETAIDTLMKDEWNKIRMAQQLAKENKELSEKSRIARFMMDSEGDVERTFQGTFERK